MSTGVAGDAPCGSARSAVHWWSKVKFLSLHVFCAVVIDFIPRLQRMCCGPRWAARTTYASGSAYAQGIFHLDQHSNVPYVHPAYSGHVSTILCAFRPHRHIRYERVTFPGGDGNPMCIDWLPAGTEESKGVFLVIPGLASWSGTNYIEHFVWFAHLNGFHCGVFNSRGMGNTSIETPRLMSGQWTEDLRAAFREGAPLSRAAVEKRCGAGVPIVAIGFSLGGLILAKFAGEESLASRAVEVDVAMVVNAPLDCVGASEQMNRGLCKALYQPHMTDGLTTYARRHAGILKDLPGLDPGVRAAFAEGRADEVLTQMKTIHDFDRCITAPTLGFASPEEYYHHISPVEWLPHIAIPVLCVCAADDPVAGEPPLEKLSSIMAANKNVALLVIPHGGHLGYICDLWDEWRGRETFMERVLHSIASSLKK